MRSTRFAVFALIAGAVFVLTLAITGLALRESHRSAARNAPMHEATRPLRPIYAPRPALRKCGDAIVRDWFPDRRIDGVYGLQCYGAAWGLLPVDGPSPLAPPLIEALRKAYAERAKYIRTMPSDTVVANPGSAATLGEVVLKVEVPSNHGYPLDEALTRLHASGLRASFPGARTPCGDLLPWVDVQSPRAPATVPAGTIVSLKFGHTPIPSPTVPLHHARWTTVPALVGRDFAEAAAQLTSIWPCVHVRGATATSASRLVVVAQDPKPGTRVRAYGVRVGQSYRPTTVDVTVAIR